MKGVRADELLKSQLALDTLELARALIMEGRVMHGDTKILRASELVKPDIELRVRGELDGYVSRGAHKLIRALDVFDIDITGKTCVDIGSSTGGFTDVMLRRGAKLVYAVDVGYNLLDYKLRQDSRVKCMERINARFIKPDDFDTVPDFGATDVSFISLKAILPPVLAAMSKDADFVALIKPQFEAEKREVGERGVVTERSVHERVLKSIVDHVGGLGWRVAGLTYSPIRGTEGNIEFLLYITGVKSNKNMHDYTIADTIDAAYDKFLKSTDLHL